MMNPGERGLRELKTGLRKNLKPLRRNENGIQESI
jgi:hypothetical protein